MPLIGTLHWIVLHCIDDREQHGASSSVHAQGQARARPLAIACHHAIDAVLCQVLWIRLSIAQDRSLGHSGLRCRRHGKVSYRNATQRNAMHQSIIGWMIDCTSSLLNVVIIVVAF